MSIRPNQVIVSLNGELYINARALVFFHDSRIIDLEKRLSEGEDVEEILSHEVGTLEALRSAIINF